MTAVPELVLIDPDSVDGALLSVFYGEPWGDGGGGRRPPFQGKDLSNTPVVELIQGMERAIAAGATIDNAHIIHQVMGMGKEMLSEEKTMALLPHLVRLGGRAWPGLGLLPATSSKAL